MPINWKRTLRKQNAGNRYVFMRWGRIRFERVTHAGTLRR